MRRKPNNLASFDGTHPREFIANQASDHNIKVGDVYSKLGFLGSPNLVHQNADWEQVPTDLRTIWYDIKNEFEEGFQIDGVYFVAGTPVIYFKSFESVDIKALAEFHCKVWNQSKVPLIIVVLPTEVRIYNGFEAPARTDESNHSEPTRLDLKLPAKAISDLWDRINIFNRESIDSGSFWREYGRFFSKEHKADRQLLANLKFIRHELKKMRLDYEHIHSLIGRSIFALYLQDRGVLEVGESGFFGRNFGSEYTRFTDILSSYSTTYAFFDLLREQFNGDMFPVTKEEKDAVKPEHLNELKRLFTVDSLSDQFLFFWAYDFEYIPIELISAIYEEFLEEEDKEAKQDKENRTDKEIEGAYYTPPSLVDFVLNQILPLNDDKIDMKILDPACGSGIFLVESYKRLVERWRRKNNRKQNPDELASILQNSIFGIDVKRQALRIAAFSLYLALLDYVEPKSIWTQVQFPKLLDINLIEADFFDTIDTIDQIPFDVVVGNPPWDSQLTTPAKKYIEVSKRPIGDKQIAQAFLWKAPQHCAKNGQIALLCPSKGLLYNRSKKNTNFRAAFFTTHWTKRIFDFSAVRRYLFENAIAPTAIIFYIPMKPRLDANIFYGAIKPTHLVRVFGIIALDSDDIKQLPLWQVVESFKTPISSKSDELEPEEPYQARLWHREDPDEHFLENSSADNTEDEEIPSTLNIWKIALWGKNFDYALLRSLKENFPSLEEFRRELRWAKPKVGFNEKGPGKREPAEWLDNAQFIPTRKFSRYYIQPSTIVRLETGKLYYRKGEPARFKAPLALFKRTFVKNRPAATFFDKDIAYTESFTGIFGTAETEIFLKAITGLLNSEFAQYYFFLTTASWGIERDEVKIGEVCSLPIPFSVEHPQQASTIAEIVDDLALAVKNNVGASNIQEKEHLLNLAIYECYGLDQNEIEIVHETIAQTIGFFNNPERSLALRRPDPYMLIRYTQAFIDTLNYYLSPVDLRSTGEILFDSNLNMLPVKFDIVPSILDVPNVTESSPNDATKDAIKLFWLLGNENISDTFRYRRNIRIFSIPDPGQGSNGFYLIKPLEQRHWTIGAAISDAEGVILEIVQPRKG